MASRYRNIKEQLSKYRLEQSEASHVVEERLATDTIEPYTEDPLLNTPAPQAHELTQILNTQGRHDNITDNKNDSSVSEETTSSSWLIGGLKMLLWLLLFGFFIEIEFGVVYFILSLFYFIYWTMKGSRRDPKTLSAYSVFNKNCERIEGTLAAEQFDRELRYGPGSVR
jgi:hypothetical protein